MPENGNPMSSIMGAVMSPVMGPVVRNPRGSSPLSITAQSNYYYLTSASPYDIGSTVSVADTEDAGGDYTVAITLTGGGTLTLAQTTGLTGSGDGTSTLSYTGTTTAINAALDGADIAGLSDETATMSITFTRNADSLATSRNVTVNAFPALAITTLDPADDATGTAYNRAAYTATFNRNIQAGTGNVVLKLVGGAALETFNIATGVGDQGGAVSISGADLVISPNVSLTDNTAHAIQIASTAIDGAQIGNADNFAGIADDTTWSFTCENTTPTLSSPLDSETGGTTATAAVTTDRGDGTLYWVVTTSATTPSHSQIVAGNDHTDTAATDSGSQAVTATGSQAVSGISGLTSETTYYTHFTQVSANSAAATPVSADGFTTDDITAPTIDSSVPADNATGVAVDSTIAITFDENVVFAYPGGGTLSLKLVGGATVETFTPSSTTAASGDNGGSVSISGAVVTITPGADMAAETAHCVRIDATCLEDGAGNAFAGIADDTTLNFTTEAAGGTLLVDLAAYWDLDEASGNRADSHTNSLDLTDLNTVTSRTGVGAGQTAASFDAANDEKFTAADNDVFTIGDQDWTFCGWVYHNEASSDFFLGKSGGGGTGGEYQFSFSSGGAVTVVARNSTNTGSLPTLSPTGASNGAWCFVWMEYNSSTDTARASINNGTKASATWTGGTNQATGVFVLGGRQTSGTDSLDGAMQACGIWNRLLTDEEITWLYNSGTAARLYADVAAY